MLCPYRGVFRTRESGNGPAAKGFPVPSWEVELAKTEAISIEGVVVKALPNAMFMVEAEVGEEKHRARCTIAGKMRKYYIRILPGDKVQIELSQYDLSRGRITYRLR